MRCSAFLLGIGPLALTLCLLSGSAMAQHAVPGQASLPKAPYTAYSADAYARALAPWREAFAAAYAQPALQSDHPELPKGFLEALAWSRTRWRPLFADQEAASCLGLPAYHGLFGLVMDGRGWFRNQVALHGPQASEAPLGENASQALLQDWYRAPAQQIPAVARNLRALYDGRSPQDPLSWYTALLQWSELPLDASTNSPASIPEYIRDAFAFGVFQTLVDPAFRTALDLEGQGPDLARFFGPKRYARLTASHRSAGDAEALPPCDDYGPANWNAADASNYSSRSGTAVSAVAIHTMQGYYAGTLSWFQNPSANVSAHYIMRASDGQITQMVCESDKAWHVGSENPYTVGIEHEGFVSDPSWYTNTVYNASAALTRNIADDHGILELRTYAKSGTAGLLTLGGCTRIKGHQHFPFQSHTDPGQFWDWPHYYKLVNAPAPMITYTASSGSLADPGGSSAYGDDQRRVWVIDPPGTAPVQLTFSSFNLEADWDYLYLYDGNSIYAPLIGSFTGTTSPGTISSSGGAMAVEFRSDCATTAPGFSASWTSSGGTACSTPSGTHTTPIGWTSATINWNPVAAADAYTVAGRRQGSSAWRTLNTPLSSKWLGIFQEGTAYEWRVRAECGSSSSGWSGINAFTTNSLRQLAESDADLSVQTVGQVWRILQNPVRDGLRVDGLPEGSRLQVYDAQGRLHGEKVLDGSSALDLSALPAGYYWLRAVHPAGLALGQRSFVRVD